MVLKNAYLRNHIAIGNMDSYENEVVDFKSLRKIDTDKGIKDLAISCVTFANRQGGKLYIGFEDKTHRPMPNQLISEETYNEAIKKLKSNLYNVAMESSGILNDEDGCQYFILTIYPSLKSFASTADGKFYIRVADQCVPMRSEDFQRVAEEKGTYQWETTRTKTSLDNIDIQKIKFLCENIRNSERVRPHIKQMGDLEILENYMLLDGTWLTNLGVLWLGDAKQRSRLLYPITVQYIVYDAQERKVRKAEWHDNFLDPQQLLLEVEAQATELKYSFDVQNGLFRKPVYHYHPKVIRELLINAFAHKSYSISGDIIISVYPDRMEISNPGGLPLGVTKDNILHMRVRRNPHLIRLLSDLCLMEGEGSGYDLIYELNAMNAKRLPLLDSDFNNVTVIQYSAIEKQALIPLFDFVSQNYPYLSQKNLIALGLIAVNEKIAATELVRLLQLKESDGGRLRNYVDRLTDLEIVLSRGTGKGTQYTVNPKLIDSVRLNVPTTLKTIEPHALKALIEEDLRRHPDSSISQIANRLPDIELKEIQKVIYNMNRRGLLNTTGGRSNRKYSLA